MLKIDVYLIPMQLVINNYGSYLKRMEGCVLVKVGNKEFEVYARKVESFLITTGTYISTDAVV